MASTSSTRRRARGPRKAPPSPQQAARLRAQAEGYRAARRQNAAEIAEDYVELIDDLIREQGEARSVDMARRLGVTHVTVTKTVQRLQREGLAHAQPYRSIFLTDKGRKLAAECRRRHELVVGFLACLGVRPEVAERDAEGIEHHVGEETLAAMQAFITRQSRR